MSKNKNKWLKEIKNTKERKYDFETLSNKKNNYSYFPNKETSDFMKNNGCSGIDAFISAA